MDGPGVHQVPEGSGEQGKMEKTGCKIVCGASKTLMVKGLMMMMMMKFVSYVSTFYIIAGIGGLLGAVAYGVWNYRRRGNMSTSVYIMHFRVIAQGMVVGAITIGMGINISIKLWERYVNPGTGTSAAQKK